MARKYSIDLEACQGRSAASRQRNHMFITRKDLREKRLDKVAYSDEMYVWRTVLIEMMNRVPSCESVETIET